MKTKIILTINHLACWSYAFYELATMPDTEFMQANWLLIFLTCFPALCWIIYIRWHYDVRTLKRGIRVVLCPECLLKCEALVNINDLGKPDVHICEHCSHLIVID